MSLIYKLATREAWERALAAGVFEGSPVDLADGFIHFSTADQARETARRHFAGQSDLVLLTVETERIGRALTWEPSHGGALFPHLYGSLSVEAVIAVRALALGDDGVPELGTLEP